MELRYCFSNKWVMPHLPLDANQAFLDARKKELQIVKALLDKRVKAIDICSLKTSFQELDTAAKVVQQLFMYSNLLDSTQDFLDGKEFTGTHKAINTTSRGDYKPHVIYQGNENG